MKHNQQLIGKLFTLADLLMVEGWLEVLLPYDLVLLLPPTVSDDCLLRNTRHFVNLRLYLHAHKQAVITCRKICW